MTIQGQAYSRINSKKAPKAIGPYSHAVRAGDTVYVSGQIALDPATGKIAGTTIEEQTRQTLKNIQAILAEAGLTLEDVVKSEVFLKDIDDFSRMNAVYAEMFGKEVKPARATMQIAKLPFDALIEIVCTAYAPQK